MQLYEIEHVDKHGQHHFQTIQGHRAARTTARQIAIDTGRRAIMRPLPSRPWKLFIVDTESGVITRSPRRFGKKEAADALLEFKAKKNGAVLIFWPDRLTGEPTKLKLS